MNKLLITMLLLLNIFTLTISGIKYQNLKNENDRLYSINESYEPIVIKENDLVCKKDIDIYNIASKTYNVDIDLIKAIEKLETGNYSSKMYYENNNTFGCKTNKGDWCSFDNKEQSTLELARVLSFYYGVKGNKYDLEEIGKEFCPNNYNWATKVKEIIDESN